MSDNQIRRIAVIGGGTSGWLIALALVRRLGVGDRRIVVVETPGPDSGALREVETALPAFRDLNRALGLDEDALVRNAGASFCLGGLFRDWAASGADYFLPYGETGASFETVPFQYVWRRARAEGLAGAFGDYALATAAARLGRFARPSRDPRSVMSTFDYGLNLDVDRYADAVRSSATSAGVERIEGAVADVGHAEGGGRVAAVVLDDGTSVSADLFVDATGLEGRLISALDPGWADSSTWLPADRIVQASWKAETPEPLFEAAALASSWRWRMPVQGRESLGLVYASSQLDDADAERQLKAGRTGEPERPARFIQLRNGRREKGWIGNCVAIGLAYGSLEPIQGVALHLVQAQIGALLDLFPDRGLAPCLAREFNRLTAESFDRARDSLALHYKLARRHERFWRDRRAQDLPESVAERLELFTARGKLALLDHELMKDGGWLAVMIGQGVMPERIDPMAQALPKDLIAQRLPLIAGMIRQAAEAMPSHKDTLAAICGTR